MLFERRSNGAGKIVGAGLLGLGLGTILGIFFAPKSGKENRENLVNWMDRMSGEIEAKVKDAKDITHEKYDQLVDAVSEKYRRAKNIKDTELDDFANELKTRWEKIKNQWNV